MRFLPFVLLVGLASAQESRTLDVYKYDANGRRVPVNGFSTTAAAGGSTKAETTRNVNGRVVPIEATEEKVLSETPSGRTIERVVKINDESGRPVRTERVVIEEQKRPDGGLNVTTSTYRSDVNGRMDLAERAVMTSSKSGETTTAETVTQRKTINGSFDTTERRSTVVKSTEKVTEADSVVYRPDLNGSMRPQEREIVKTETTPTGSRTEATLYNTKSSRQAGDGLEFATQSVSETVVAPNGAQSTVTDVYAQSAPGRASAGTKPQLKERLVVERKPLNGGYVEAFSVQRPEVADGRLGKPQPVSETVCTGSCLDRQKK